jgi:large subunit ribosomal protein L4
MDEKKTKKFAEVLANINAVKPLVILPENDENVVYSARNIEDAMTALPETINVYDIMKAGTLVLTKDSVKKIEEVYA